MVGNSLKQCKGVITRRRVTTDNVEESIINFVIMSEDLSNEVEEILVDDSREHVLTRLTKTKKRVQKLRAITIQLLRS